MSNVGTKRMQEQILQLQGKLELFDCDAAFAVIVFFLKESLRGFNSIQSARLETRLQSVKVRRLLKTSIIKQNISLCDI